MLVDSHCHLNMLDLTPYPEGVKGVLEEAAQAGVERCLCVSVDWENGLEVCTIAHHFAPVFSSVGVHPNEQEGHDPSVDELVERAQLEKVVAIGETGLDYYRIDAAEADWQRERFARHIQAAIKTELPLIIHTRAAREDTIAIMRSEQANLVGGVMHCFTESWEMAQQALDLGFYISISGIVTFKNAQDLKEIAKKVPLDRLLVETDAPYLAPVPHRGKANVPAYTRHVAEYVAELRDLSLDSLAKATTENFFKLFKKAAVS